MLLLRLALLLGATPVGGLRQEILYLRGDRFRPLGTLVLAFLLLEAVQLALPVLSDAGTLREPLALAASAVIDLVQAALLVVVAVGTLRVFGPYSRRSIAELEVVARRSVAAIVTHLPRVPVRIPPRVTQPPPAGRSGVRRGP